VDYSIEKVLPDDYIKLFWQVFFLDKGRGLNVESHFPWIQNSIENIWCVVLRDNNKVFGGLVVRPLQFGDGENHLEIGTLGLVCVHPDYRGCGCAKKLIELAINESKSLGYDALTLWTNKWELYSPHGFLLYDESLFGWVHTDEMLCTDITVGETHIETFPGYIGLPAFAISGKVFLSKGARVVVVQDTCGEIVVGWSGSISTIIGILKQQLPCEWRINAQAGDALIRALIGRNAVVELNEVQLQMWNVFNEHLDIQTLAKKTQMGVLERI